MLVLSRKEEERILIGDDIEVVVLSIRGDRVRLGFKAPTEIPVHRQEVYEAIRRDRTKQSHPFVASPDGGKCSSCGESKSHKCHRDEAINV